MGGKAGDMPLLDTVPSPGQPADGTAIEALSIPALSYPGVLHELSGKLQHKGSTEQGIMK